MQENRTTKGGDSKRRYGIASSGFRLPADTQLGPVHLQIADLRRSTEWYVEVLGFRASEPERGQVTLSAIHDDRPIIILHERVGATPIPPRGRLGLYHYAILLPSRADLGRLLRHLHEAGVRVGASDHLVSEAIYLSDPDGLGIEVYTDRPRSSWRVSGLELQMTTNPLNLYDVLTEAGDSDWMGMPTGTGIGHIHLHVGDLDAASRFYHDAVGFDRVVWSYPGALFLSAGGYHHHLGTNVWAADADPASEADAKLLEWTIEVPDLRSLNEARTSIEYAGFPIEHSSENDFLTRDPWGVGLRVRTNPDRPSASWHHHDAAELNRSA